MGALYTYPNVVVNSSKLRDEINNCAAIIPGCLDVSTRGAVVEILLKSAFETPEQRVVLDGIVAMHDPTPREGEQVLMMSMVENQNYGHLDLSYKMKPFLFHIPAGAAQVHEFPISFPYPVMVLGATVDLCTTHHLDEMQFDSLDWTPVGQLITNAVVGADFITVNDAAAAGYIFKGFDLIVNNEFVGHVLDKGGNNIYLDRPIVTPHAAGSYVVARYTTVDRYKVLSAPMVLWVSRDTDRGALAGKSQKMKFYYWNNNGTEKDIQLNVEIYI